MKIDNKKLYFQSGNPWNHVFYCDKYTGISFKNITSEGFLYVTPNETFYGTAVIYEKRLHHYLKACEE